MMSALKLGEEAAELKKERDHLLQQVQMREAAAASSDSSASIWQRKYEASHRLLTKEKLARKNATIALDRSEKQLPIMKEQLDVGKKELELAEGRAAEAEARAISTEEWIKNMKADLANKRVIEQQLAVEKAEKKRIKKKVDELSNLLSKEGADKGQLKKKADELSDFLTKEKADGEALRQKVNQLVGILNEEKTSKEAFQKRNSELLDELSAEIAAKDEITKAFKAEMETFTNNFLYNMWLKHPEIDYSFFGEEAVATIKKYEAYHAKLKSASGSIAPQHPTKVAEQGVS